MKKQFLIILFLFLLSNPSFAVTNTWQNGGVDNNWSTSGNWNQGHKPSTGEDVVIAAAYDCVVNENTAAINSLNMTGYANTVTGNGNIAIKPNSGTVNVILGGTISLSAGTTIGVAPAIEAIINFYQNGASWTTASILAFGSTTGGTFSGNVYVRDNITLPSTATVNFNIGTLHLDGLNDNSGLTHSFGMFTSSNTNPRTLTLGTSSITLTGTGASTIWSTGTSTDLTVTSNTANITISDTGATQKNFLGGGKTFYNLSIPAGTGGVGITGANIFNQVTVTAGGKIILPTTDTTTVSYFVATGYSGNLITFVSSASGVAAALNKSTIGRVQTDWVNITDVNVTPAKNWYYGNNSTWNSGTGWNSGNIPSSNNSMQIGIGIHL